MSRMAIFSVSVPVWSALLFESQVPGYNDSDRSSLSSWVNIIRLQGKGDEQTRALLNRECS